MGREIPPLTPGQRAKIKIVDLAKPPPFIRVLKNIDECAEIPGCDDPLISAWVYRPDWGDVEDFFDRRAPKPTYARFPKLLIGKDFSTDDVAGYGSEENIKEVLAYPNSDQFVRASAKLAYNALLAMPDFATASFEIYVEYKNQFNSTDIHLDDIYMRMFFASEYGNLLLIDGQGMAVKGYKPHGDHMTLPSPNAGKAFINDVLDHDIDVYATPLGAVTFMRGMKINHGVRSWHAVHEVPSNPAYGRPACAVDFNPA